MKNTTIQLAKWQIEKVNELKRAIADNPARVIATVKKVAPSGCSRVINFCFINDKREVDCINGIINIFAGYKIDTKIWGLRVYGGGMDMAFAVLYDFYRALQIPDSLKLANRYTLI
ncbi:MAG: hypothetical protein FWG57_02545 [Endomicrobia bacterium]|nr:hypothetical protein [Endomicrobiia bacterium]